MNRDLLQQLSEGPHDRFIKKFQTSRYEFAGIELYDDPADSRPIAHRMIASGHQGKVRFKLSDIVGAVEEIGARAIVMLHNHPFSNTFKASRQDIEVTEAVHRALLKIGAQVADHRIYIEEDQVFSFVREKVGRWGWESLDFD